MTPALRKPLAGLSIILFLGIYGWAVGSVAHLIGQLPVLLQAVAYLVLGIAWVPLLMPIIRFSETGRFTRPKR